MSDVAPNEPTAPQPRPPAPAPQIIVQQQASAFGRYGKFVLMLLGLAVMVIIGMAGAYRSYFSPPGEPQERYHSLSETAADRVAIIRIEGTILDDEPFAKNQIDRVMDDDSVVGVVLRIDSPGGTVTASDFLYHHVRKLADEREMPVVVSMGSMCASGGYYIAMAVGETEDTIFAEPTTWTGSIGVVIPHYDLSGLLAAWNVQDNSIASHPNKLMGSPTRDLDAEQRAAEQDLFQELVDRSFLRFKSIVLAGRPQLADDQEKLQTVTTGRIFTASQALELGLVDKIGFIEDAVNRVAELTGRESESLRCVEYQDPPPSLGELLGASAPVKQSTSAELRSLLDLATPRAYYLCTWLPGMITSSRAAQILP